MSGPSVFTPIAVKTSVVVAGAFLLSELISWRRAHHEEVGTVETLSDVAPQSNYESAPGAAVPLSKVPYTKPATYTSAPIDPNNLPTAEWSYGPYNDPRRNVVYNPNMARIQYSGMTNKADTNLLWPSGDATTGTEKKESKRSSCGCKGGHDLCKCSGKEKTVKLGVGVKPGNTLFFK